MVLTFIALWTITICLLLIDPKKDTIRWAALITFCGGFGAFGRSMIETFLPYLSKYDLGTPNMNEIFTVIYNIGSLVNTNGLPYAFIMFCICYSGYFSKKLRVRLTYMLLIPIPIMLSITSLQPRLMHPYSVMIFWVAPYILLGSFLLIRSYSQEKNSMKKKHKALTNVLAITPTVFQLFSNYVSKVFHYDQAWRLNAIVITALFIYFIVIMMRYGFFGIKLKIEQQRIESTLRSFASGTGILNHTIKNEISLLSMCFNNISRDYKINEDNEDIKDIRCSIERMSAMASRIQDKMQDIILKEGPYPLEIMINKSLETVKHDIDKKNIQVNMSGLSDVMIICDDVHIREVLSNIFKNSIEAISSEGVINIQTHKGKRIFSLIIMDNGKGISKDNVSRVIEPFFTTKKNTMNYGLGLSHSYAVLQKTGGNIEIESEENVGTSVSLHFPIKKFSQLGTKIYSTKLN